MDVIEYSDKASNLLLKELYKVVNDENLKELIHEYKDVEEDVDVTWSIIATALLLSENTSENMPAYDDIHDSTAALLIDNWLTEDYYKNVALNEKNVPSVYMKNLFDYCENPNLYKIKSGSYNPLYSTYEFSELPTEDDKIISNNHKIPEYEYEEEYEKFIYTKNNNNYYKNIDDDIFDSEARILDFGKYTSIYENRIFDNLTGFRAFLSTDISGLKPCIESILDENKQLDLTKLIFRVRCAIAHSECDYNDNYAHLYHKTNDDKYDFNVILDNNSLLFIIDELAETAYDYSDKYSDIFDSNYDSYERVDIINDDYMDKLEKKVLTDEEIIEIFKSYKYSNESIIIDALDRAKKSIKNWENPELDEGYDIFTKEDENFTKNEIRIIQILEEFPRQNQKILIEIGTVLNYYVHSREDDTIGEEYIQKQELYKYLNSNMYKTQYSTKNDSEYKEELAKILILSYLNTVLCNNYNALLNNNNSYYGINVKFPDMDINSGIMNSFNIRLVEKQQNLLTEAHNRLLSLKRNYKKLNASRKKNIETLKNNKIDNEYFNVKLPSIIENQIAGLRNTIKEIKETKKKIVELGHMSTEEEESAFIGKSLRNSIAHGNVFFSSDDIKSDTYIIFKDYDENNNLTFDGKIKIGDLLKTLMDNKSKFFEKTEKKKETVKTIK